MCPDGWTRLCVFLFGWQTLIAGLLALVAAIVSFAYLHKQIDQTEQLEAKRQPHRSLV